MFRPQAQAEKHSNQAGAPRTSSPTHAETHSKAPGLLLLLRQLSSKNTQRTRRSSTYFTKRQRCCKIATLIFFLFMCRLQAQARTGPGSVPRGSRKDLFFLFINRLQAQAQAHDTAAAKTDGSGLFFIDSP
jgi:hypothetical protein